MDRSSLIASVGAAKFAEACAAARIDSARPDFGHGVGEFDSDIPTDLCCHIWESDLTDCAKLDLTLALYDEMPCFAYLLGIGMHLGNLELQEQERFVDWVGAVLATADASHSQPVEYALWCELFENPRTVELAWARLTSDRVPDRVLEIVLPNSGPVPLELKAALYERLLPERRWHAYIFRSLLYSAFDYYGQFDPISAQRVFDRLQLADDTPHLATFRERLNSALGSTGSDAPE